MQKKWLEAGAVLMLSVPLTLSMTTGAHAQSLLCDNGAEERIIEVIKPGNVGRACDLRVVSNGGETVSVPYNANNQESYCESRIPDVVKMLAASNFKCAVTQTFADAQAEAAGNSDAAVAAAPAQPLTLEASIVAAAPEADADAEIETFSEVALSQPTVMAASEPDVVSAYEPEPREAQTPQPTDAAIDAGTAGSLVAQLATEDFADQSKTSEADLIVAQGAADVEEASTLLDQPLVDASASDQTKYGVATGAPTQLSDQQKIAQLNTPRPARPAAGLVAAPAPTNVPEPIVERVVVTSGRPLTAERTVEGSSAVKPKSPTASEIVGSGRPAADIIRAVLMAQVAAWNEGDIDAYLVGYWNSPELRFVSGNDVTIGWRNVAKRYRERYATPEQMGVLRFSEIDVDQVDSGVAVVVGRFSHRSETGVSEGSFSLVMRQIGGLWRIVHDHTTTDGAPTAMRDL